VGDCGWDAGGSQHEQRRAELGLWQCSTTPASPSERGYAFRRPLKGRRQVDVCICCTCCYSWCDGVSFHPDPAGGHELQFAPTTWGTSCWSRSCCLCWSGTGPSRCSDSRWWCCPRRAGPLHSSGAGTVPVRWEALDSPRRLQPVGSIRKCRRLTSRVHFRGSSARWSAVRTAATHWTVWNRPPRPARGTWV